MAYDPHQLSTGHQNHVSPAAGPRPQLVPKSAEEAILFMFKAFHEFPDEIRLAMYQDTLDGCSMDEVWAAVKHWSRHPHDRAAQAGELRDMILTARGNKAPIQTQEESWEQARATPEEKQQIIATLTPKARAFLREACPWLFEGERPWQR